MARTGRKQEYPDGTPARHRPGEPEADTIDGRLGILGSMGLHNIVLTVYSWNTAAIRAYHGTRLRTFRAAAPIRLLQWTNAAMTSIWTHPRQRVHWLGAPLLRRRLEPID